jgi:hypothetical protein
MSVVFNEPALQRLLHSEAGPVGQEVQQRAERVFALAQQNTRTIIWRSPLDAGSFVGLNISSQQEGVVAEIGLKAAEAGRIAHYLAEKEAREGGEGRGWLVRALAEVFPG